MPSTSVFTKHGILLDAFHSVIRNSGEKIREIAGTVSASQHKDFVRYVQVYTEYIRHHHTSEDKFTFPAFASKCESVKKLESDHDALKTALDSLDVKLAHWTTNIEEYNSIELIESVKAVEAILLPHLDSEEEILNPEYLEKNFTEAEVQKVLDDTRDFGKTYDGKFSLPFMYYNMSQKGREEWWDVELPMVLRWVVFPTMLAPVNSNLWAYTKSPPSW